MENAIDYSKILQRAYQVSMYYVKEDDTAKDIAQATAIKYFLNKEKIEKKGSNSWIYTVSKNLSLNHLKKYKRELAYSNAYFEEHLHSNVAYNKNNIEIDDIDIFNMKEKNLLKQYYEKPAEISLLAKKYKMKKSVLLNKIYSLEQERKLFELLNSGVLRTKSIPGTKLHRNIQNFLNKLQTCLKNNNLMKMKHYFSNCKINEEVMSIDIEKIAQYDIEILEKNRYMLNIGYYNPEHKVKFLRIRFEISEGSTINVIEFPIIPKKVIAFDAKDIPIELLRQLQPNEKGVIPLSQEEVEKLLETQKDNTEVLVDKKNSNY